MKAVTRGPSGQMSAFADGAAGLVGSSHRREMPGSSPGMTIHFCGHDGFRL